MQVRPSRRHPDRAPLRRPVVGLLLALAVLPLGACSEPSEPAGWTRQEVGSLSLALPEAWQPLPAETFEGTELWQEGVQDETGDDASVQVLLGPDLGDDRDAATASARLLVGAQVGATFQDWDTSGATEVEVPGATSAERWDFTYTGEDGSTVSGVWLFVADSGTRRSAALQITGDPLDSQLVFDMIGSVRFDAGAPPVGADPA